MRTYETTFIISGAASEGNREAIIARYEKLLTDNGADFKRVVRWGKRQLAYPIKKQVRGYYVIYYYDADPSIINPMHREMDLNELILRYMTLVSDGIHPDYVKDEGEPDDVVAVEPEVLADDDDVDADEETDADDDDDLQEEETDTEDDDVAAGETTEEAVDEVEEAAIDDTEEVVDEETIENSDDAASDEPSEDADSDDAVKEVE